MRNQLHEGSTERKRLKALSEKNSYSIKDEMAMTVCLVKSVRKKNSDPNFIVASVFAVRNRVTTTNFALNP